MQLRPLEELGTAKATGRARHRGSTINVQSITMCHVMYRRAPHSTAGLSLVAKVVGVDADDALPACWCGRPPCGPAEILAEAHRPCMAGMQLIPWYQEVGHGTHNRA